jgi:hypothetical protein
LPGRPFRLSASVTSARDSADRAPTVKCQLLPSCGFALHPPRRAGLWLGLALLAVTLCLPCLRESLGHALSVVLDELHRSGLACKAWCSAGAGIRDRRAWVALLWWGRALGDQLRLAPTLESASMPTTKQNTCAEASIRMLRGLEPVKQRPGMCTRTDNRLHIVQEVIDNVADEALAGHGQRIGVTLHADGSISVDDDGRGIPFGLHHEEQVPVIEIVKTRLNAGVKFDKGAGGACSFSGGLCGVEVSLTNAPAKRLQASVWREGQMTTLTFAGGEVIEPLVVRKATSRERKHGISVRVWPDSKYFESAELPRHDLMHLLRRKAVLMPGVPVTLATEKSGQKEIETQT